MKEGMLLFIYKNNRAINLQHLKVIFKDAIFMNWGSHILVDAKAYDKESILKNIQDYNTGQYTFTQSRIEKLIKKCMDIGLSLEGIQHWDDIEYEKSSFIEDLINELKRKDISINLRNLFLRELTHILRDIEYELFSDNSVSLIEFKTPNGNEISFSRNNFVSFEEEDIDTVKEIISSFIE